jgi:hypothetical protein
MSQPSTGWPGSDRGAGSFGVVRLAFAFFVLIFLSGWGPGAITKKPTTVASRGLLSQFSSGATSPGGVAVGYDDRDRTHPDRQRIH